MSKDKLDKYEAELEKEIDNAASLTESQKNICSTILINAADKYVKKDKRISIRVYGDDLLQIKKIAEREGLPYQTLITSVLHKFATGLLSNRNQL